MTTVITREMVEPKLRELGRLHPDRRFDPHMCVYGDQALGHFPPVCIAGHVLHDLLPTDDWRRLVVYHNRTKIDASYVWEHLETEIEPNALWLLRQAQRLQDNSYPWEAAVENALSET